MSDTEQRAGPPPGTTRSAAFGESPHLAPISRPSITDEIVNRLIRLILDERLRPGDRLPTEHELASQMAVGRSSLREAIKTLRAIGVVDVVNGNGMFVGGGGASLGSKPLSWGLLMRDGGPRELIDARRLVEAELASLAAQRASAEEIAAMGRLAMTRAAPLDAEGHSRAAVEFHLAVARAARNTVLSYFMEGLQHILRAWITNTYEADPQETVRVPDEHVPIYEAIRARDAGRAREAMATHIDEAGARLLRMLGQMERTSGGEGRTTRLTWAWPGAEAE
jgi:GntR family transcriptional regulator, transcriptional repressor for pyruvate dehydrogenase complex